MLISSQRYVEEEIIEEKMAGENFEVLITPKFIYDGDEYQIVIGGHHRLEAAKRLNKKPDYKIATAQDHDAVDLLNGDEKKIEMFFELNQNDSDWYNVETGLNVWA